MTTAPSFFHDVQQETWILDRNDNTDEECWGSLKKSSSWVPFVQADRPDPGSCEFRYTVVPRIVAFGVGYSGFRALRHLLTSLFHGLEVAFNATHFGFRGGKMAFDSSHVEQTVRLEVMLAGQHDRHPIEVDDFVTVSLPRGKEKVALPAQVRGLHMAVIDGKHWVEVMLVCAWTLFI